MKTTIKTVTIALTKLDLKVLTELTESLGETQSNVIRKALIFYKFYMEKEDEKSKI